MSASMDLAKLCVVRGDFILHSGKRSDWIFDVGKAWEHLSTTPWIAPLVAANKVLPGIGAGIEFWGSMIVARGSPKFHIVIRNDGSLRCSWSAPVGEDRYARVILFNDVVTTGASMEMAQTALEDHGFDVIAKTCILNRGQIPDILSLVSMDDVETILNEGA